MNFSFFILLFDTNKNAGDSQSHHQHFETAAKITL
jgi:hypothetical protein